MYFELKNVALSRIDSEDHTYRITTALAIERLALSVEKVGLITPPILVQKKTKYRIVSGFRRVAACREIGWSAIDARILAADTAPLDSVRLAIADNSFHGSLNLIELSRAFHMLSALIDNERSLLQTASALGLPEDPSFVEKIKKIYHLSQAVQSCILSDTISLPIALELSGLDPEAEVHFVALFEQLKLGLNRQREIITLVKEIAKREDTTIKRVIQDEYLQENLNNANMDRGQKTEKIRSYLRSRRFPAIAKAEGEFENEVNELKLGSGLKLIPPKNFEDSTYTFVLRFQNPEELKARFTHLGSVIQNPHLNKILIK